MRRNLCIGAASPSFPSPYLLLGDIATSSDFEKGLESLKNDSHHCTAFIRELASWILEAPWGGRKRDGGKKGEEGVEWLSAKNGNKAQGHQCVVHCTSFSSLPGDIVSDLSF